MMPVDQYMKQLPVMSLYYIKKNRSDGWGSFRSAERAFSNITFGYSWGVDPDDTFLLSDHLPFPPSTPDEREAYWTGLGRS